MSRLRLISLGLFLAFSLILGSLVFPIDPYQIVQAIVKFITKSTPIELYSWEVVSRAAIDTILMSLVGTTIGFAMALFAAAASNHIKGRGKSFFVLMAQFARSVPDFVFALIFAQVLGIGPVAGAIAITLGTFGVSFKTLLQMFQGSKSAAALQLRRAGASGASQFFAADLPSNATEILAQFSYRFEINLRIATIIGITGAGGLGLLLRNSIGMLDYKKAAGVVLLIVFTIFMFEYITKLLRSRLNSGLGAAIGNPFSSLTPVALLVFCLSIIAIWSIENESSLRWAELVRVFAGALDFRGFELPSSFLESSWQSILLTLGTVGSSFFLALLLAISSSKQRSVIPSLSTPLRFLTGVARAVPTIVWALILIPHFGLGLSVAAAAITIGASLLVARIISDVLDSYDFPDLRSLAKSGVGRVQLATLAVRKTSSQRIIRALFFLADFTMRYSVILGILGVGGLGSELNNALRLQDYNTVFLVVLVLGLWLFVVEKLESLYFSAAPIEIRKPRLETRA